MSSLAGHAAAGVAAYLCCNRWTDTRTRWALGLFVFLAICPDFDYFAVWLFGYAAHPRFTHGLLFGLVMALLVRLATRRCSSAHLPLPALLAAAWSHPLLDLLVGAHGLPLLWPLARDIALPVGVLPSAGALRWNNTYLWRNLLIELAVLVPAYAGVIAVMRRTAWRVIRPWAIWLTPVWAVFVAWSYGLPR